MVGETVGYTDQAGQLLIHLIEAEIPKYGVALTYAYPWATGKKPTIEQLRECGKWRAEVQQMKPKVNVLMGATAMKAFGFPRPWTPMNRCSEVVTQLPDSVLPCPAVISVCPSYVLKVPASNKRKALRLMQLVFATVKHILVGSQQDSPLLVTSLSELTYRLAQCAKLRCGVDIETSSLESHGGVILCAAIAPSKGEAFCIPLFHPQMKWPRGSTPVRMLQAFKDWLPLGPRVMQNAKHELSWLAEPWPATLVDTMLLRYLSDENKHRGLDHIVIDVLGEAPYWQDIVGKGNFAEHPLEKLAPYNIKDADVTRRAEPKLRALLTPAMNTIHDEILAPLVKTLVRMESAGVCIDEKKFIANRLRLEEMLDTQRKKVKKHLGVNPRSHKQVSELLFDDMGLKSPIKTKKNNPSANAEALERLAEKEPKLKYLLELRQLESLMSRIYDPWHSHLRNGFIHTDFTVGYVVTGRLSSTNPNLQNLERGDETKPWLQELNPRALIISRHRKGKLIQLDYAQHELRVIATMRDMQKLLDVFDRGESPHKQTAAECGITYADAKCCNFSLLYGGTEHTLFNKYNVPLSRGRILTEKWFTNYPEILEYHAWCDQELLTNGYLDSVFGWRRRLPNARDPRQRRQAYNFPVQNAGVVLSFMAMNELGEALRHKGYKAEIILQVHDSIIIDSPASEVAEVTELAKSVMLRMGTDCLHFTGARLRRPIPVGVDVKIGDTL